MTLICTHLVCKRIPLGWIPWLCILAVTSLISSTSSAQTLEAQLLSADFADLAKQARQTGDATRGAILFHQPQMSCVKCHVTGDGAKNALGPNLTTLSPQTSDASLVESVLLPSKVIAKEYASVSILTQDGSLLSGIVAERTAAHVIMKDASRPGQLITIQADDIEQFKSNELSLMPAGQVNQLSSRQQFLDLVRYLIEIRDGGLPRAQQLQPAASLLAFRIPEYEEHLDHAGLINSWDEESLERGEAIYLRVCVNCHGTREAAGSLPTSLRFAEGKFKNGSDPLSMYRTLTHGFGLMAPQTWMVPSQKYDVIHYIREAYLKPFNASQYVSVDEQYKNRLPKGDTRGPEPSKIEAWSAMDYGPSLAHTYEIPGKKHNFAYKGIAVRLDPGAGGVSRGQHWMMFDTDTLRMAAAWSDDGESLNTPTSSRANFAPDANDTATAGNKKAPENNGAEKKRAEKKGAEKKGAEKKADDKNAPEKTGGKKQAEKDAGPSHFIDWRSIQFNGQHGIHPKIVGRTIFTNATGPGWANPSDGQLSDNARVIGRDGKRYGPLPRSWGQYKGQYHHGQSVVFDYRIGSTDILESPRLVASVSPQLPNLVVRTLNVGPRDRELILQVAEHSSSDVRLTHPDTKDATSVLFTSSDDESLRTGFAPASVDAVWSVIDGKLTLRIPPGPAPLRFSIWFPVTAPADNKESNEPAISATKLQLSVTSVLIPEADLDLSRYTHGGPARWAERLTSQVIPGADDVPFAADVLTAPDANPWLALLRFTGLDFFPDGRMAVCTWDGDVWIVSPDDKLLKWQRIASGLFQPLGLKIVDQKIYLTCRDQLAVLHDLDGDGETDFYECFNNDHQVTEHFHEFAMGLQRDAAGNFYYAKSGCHGKPAVVPHHGTLLRVSPDGTKTDILANGFRAANGVCLNPDGSFVVTDQEGFWNPKNRINWVTLSGSSQPNFYGNMLGYHDVTDTADEAMEPPLCWITNAFDRSPAELLWVDSPRWGGLNGSLLNLSYGYGKVFLVPHERVHGKMQGGMIELPIPAFPTGVMRGRFNPLDGQLYLCGMFAWAGNATQPGGLYRLRATGQPAALPIGLHAAKRGMQLTFTEPIDPASIDMSQIGIKSWDLQRTANYGSKHFNERSLDVRAARLSDDHKTLTIEIADIKPTWCMEIQYSLRTESGSPVQGTIDNTIHELAE